MRSPLVSRSGTSSGTPRRALRLAVAAVVVLSGTGIALLAAMEPRRDREWIPEQRVQPSVRFDGHLVQVEGVRHFRYESPTRFAERHETRTYDLNALDRVWFVLTPFYDTWRGPAHSFVTFGFADSQYVSISVEARREVGETYGPVAGLLNRYELIYVIGDERDVIGQRAIFNDFPVYLYPIRASRERIREVFVEMLRRANGLGEHPEFYNTLTNNCTSNVIAHVNAVAGGAIPSGLKTMLPGYTDEVALELGLIDSKLDLEQARERFRVNERARAARDAPDFSRRIRDVHPTVTTRP